MELPPSPKVELRVPDEVRQAGLADAFVNQPLSAVPELRPILIEQGILEKAPGSDEYRLSEVGLIMEELRSHGPMFEDELTEAVTAKLVDRDLIEMAAEMKSNEAPLAEGERPRNGLTLEEIADLSGVSVEEARESARQLIADGLLDHIDGTEYYRANDLALLREEAGLPLTGLG